MTKIKTCIKWQTQFSPWCKSSPSRKSTSSCQTVERTLTGSQFELWSPHTAWSSSTNLWMTTTLCLSLATGSVDLLIDSPGKSAKSRQTSPTWISILSTPPWNRLRVNTSLWSLQLRCHHPWGERCLTPLLTLKTSSDQYHYYHAVIARIREQIMSQEISVFSFT